MTRRRFFLAPTHPGVIGVLLLGALVVPAHASPHRGPVTDIEVAGKKVFSVSQAGIIQGVGDEARVFAKPPFRVTSLWGSSRSEVLFFAGGEPGVSGSIGARSLDSEQDVPATRQLAEDLLYDLAVDLETGVIAVAGADGKILILEALPNNAREQQAHRHTAAARAVVFSPDGKWLASAGLDGVVMISAVGDAPAPAPRQLLDHTAGVESLVFSPDSQFLASGSKDSKVRIHEVSGKLVRTYHGLGMEDEPVAGRVPSRVLSLAWNEAVLLAGTSKGLLYRLSLTDDTVRPFARSGRDPIYALAFDSAGEVLAGTESRVEVLRE